MAAGGSRDPEQTADRLIAEYGSFDAVVAASRHSLFRTVGQDTAAIDAVMNFRSAVLHLLRRAVDGRCVIANWQSLLDYLHVEMAHSIIERVRVLYLNVRNVLIRDELMSEGSIDEASLYPREVIRRALEVGAAKLILVHNHPSGDPSPSKADISVTRTIADAGRKMEISLLDHVILTPSGHASFRHLGLI